MKIAETFDQRPLPVGEPGASDTGMSLDLSDVDRMSAVSPRLSAALADSGNEVLVDLKEIAREAKEIRGMRRLLWSLVKLFVLFFAYLSLVPQELVPAESRAASAAGESSGALS